MKKFYAGVFLLALLICNYISAQTYYDMSSSNYSQDFSSIANSIAWPNGFNGAGSQMWRGLAVNATGLIPSATRITTATNTAFSTGTSGGVQKGTGNIQLLSTGATNNSSSAAIELYLNFSGRVAGNLSFDAAQVANTGGDRPGSLKVYASIDGSNFTELTTSNLPFTVFNNVASSSQILVALPVNFDNAPNARLRFYYYNGSTGGSTGARPKISIDNILVTSSPISSFSSNSDIIRSTTFTEPGNIPYHNFQAADISGTGLNDVKIGEFMLRDGGAANDADNEPTILTSLTLSLSNSPNIRRVAIYDVNGIERGEVNGAGTITFNAILGIQAPDNGSTTFSIYASFNTSVIDNQQIQLTITNAAANFTGSLFSTTNAGGAATSNISDRNRIEVTATRLVFVQQPGNTSVLTNMAPAVTVAARDAIGFNNTDLDFMGLVNLAITTTSCGTLTGNTITALNGIATFNSLQGTVAESGLTLTGTASGLFEGISTNFNFTSISASETTLAFWDFNDQNAIVDQSISSNAGKTISAQGGSLTVKYFGGPNGTGNGDYAYSADNTWVGSNDTKWWEIDISTMGYQSILISSQQSSSGTGPRDFKLQYKIGIGGTWIDISGGNIVVGDNYSGGVVSDLPLPSVCENQSSIFLRWIVNSNFSVAGASITNSAASSRIDNIQITGILLTASNNLFYQSKASGSFESACLWETSLTGTGGWLQAAAPPDFSAKTIRILNTHVVSINNNVVLDELIVDDGGTLEVNNASVNWNNGSGIDFVVNGTYIDNAPSTNSSSFSTDATWQLGPSGTFLKTRNSGVAQFRDRYEGGMINIPASANWILRYTGASDVAFTTVGGTVYPNLTFENSSVTNPFSFFTTFSGSGDFPIIKGNLDIGGSTFSNGVIVTNENTNATGVVVLGNLIVRAGSTLRNTDGASTNGTGFDVVGNIVNDGVFTVNGLNGSTGLLSMLGTNTQFISGSGTFNFNNITLNNSAGAEVLTNITVGGTLQLQSGPLSVLNSTLGINGGVARNAGTLLTTNASSLSFGPNATMLTLPNGVFSANPLLLNNLTLNRAGGLNLGNQGITIMGSLELIDGILDNASTNTLTLGPLATTTGGSPTSFINGPLSKQINNTTTATGFSFPIGKTAPVPRYRPVSIADYIHDGATTTTYTAEFMYGSTQAIGSDLFLDLVEGIWAQQYWNITKAGGAPAGARVGIPNADPEPADGSWHFVGPPSGSNVAVSRFNGSNWVFTRPEAQFSNGLPYYEAIAENDYANTVFSGVLTTFSPFTMGHSTFSVLKVLPINLTIWQGRIHPQGVELHWGFGGELLPASVTIQYSTDGRNFVDMATVKTHAASQYKHFDRKRQAGIHYYRLKVNSPDGNFEFSKVLAFNTGKPVTVITGLLQNPVQGNQANVLLLSAMQQQATVQLVDASGRVLITQNLKLQEGAQTLPIYLPALTKGMYFLQLTTQDGVQKAMTILK